MEAMRILLTAPQAEMPSFSLVPRAPLRRWGALCRGVGVGSGAVEPASPTEHSGTLPVGKPDKSTYCAGLEQVDAACLKSVRGDRGQRENV